MTNSQVDYKVSNMLANSQELINNPPTFKTFIMWVIVGLFAGLLVSFVTWHTNSNPLPGQMVIEFSLHGWVVITSGMTVFGSLVGTFKILSDRSFVNEVNKFGYANTLLDNIK